MTQWFRMYSDVVHDPKVQRLDPEVFRMWVNILCISAQHLGDIPPIDDLAFMLRLDIRKARSMFDKLVAAGLIDKQDEGFAPHNWEKRQFKSDTSKERTKKWREKKCDVTVTSLTRVNTDTDTDTETDTEVAKATTPLPPKGAATEKIPDWVPPEPWKGFVEMRKKIRAPLTQQAEKLAIRKLDGFRARGHDPTEILEQSILNDWKDLYEPKGEKHDSGNRGNASFGDANAQKTGRSGGVSFPAKPTFVSEGDRLAAKYLEQAKIPVQPAGNGGSKPDALPDLHPAKAIRKDGW